MGVTGGTSSDSKELLSRGAAILAATVEHLLSSTDISNAEEIVLYGEKSKICGHKLSKTSNNIKL